MPDPAVIWTKAQKNLQRRKDEKQRPIGMTCRARCVRRIATLSADCVSADVYATELFAIEFPYEKKREVWTRHFFPFSPSSPLF
jgi:hypothetical protein